MGESESHPSLTQIKKLFQEWHVRGAILASLFLQVLLLFLATYRKRTSNYFVQTLVYVVYNLSSMVANVAFALTVGAQWFAISARMPFGFWGAFALLHLAGQECLTAYSMEDCDAWLTSFFSLVWQYFLHFLIVMSQGDDDLPLLTAIIFSIALIWLFARTLRLRLGMLEMSGFSQLPDPYPLILNDGEKLLLSSSRTDVLHSVIDARRLLGSSLRLIAGLKHGRGRHSSEMFKKVQRHFVDRVHPEQAMRIVEVELNFIYDSFYTDGIIRKHLDDKYSRIYASLGSYASLCCVFTLIAFISSRKMGKYSGEDHSVTCILLWGTLILEFLSYLRMVFSDWTIASVGEENAHLLLSVSPHWCSRWSDNDVGGALAWGHSWARVMLRRWSETISKFNFVSYSIRQPEELPADYIIRPDVLTGITGFMRSLKFVSSEWYTDELGIFIFNELRWMPTGAISSFRREWGEDDSYKNVVFVWHIATEVLYNFDNNAVRKEKSDNDDDDLQDRRHNCQHSKLLSDYMAYLLFMKPRSMSRLRGNPLVDIERARASVKEIALDKNFKEQLQSFCQKILTFQPPTECQDDWKAVINVITEVVNMAHRTPDHVRRWSKVSRKWVELLWYAASESDPLEHVRGLCQGGELVSLVWLLAFHLGLL